MGLTDIQYKDSEVGRIPLDWEVMRLYDCCKKITDGTHDTPKPVDIGVPYLTAIHVKQNVIDYKNCYFLPKEVHDIIYKRCNPEHGDVLMVNIGAGVATTAFIDVDYEFSLKNVALLKPKINTLSGAYLHHYQSYAKQRIVSTITSGGAQPFLSLKQIGDLQIALPTKSEQTAIATALSDTDALIENLEKLIAKKRNIKQGVMQELLTGRKRLAGFNGEWMKIKLGDICDIRKGQLITEKTAAGGEFPVIAGGINPSYFHNRPNRGKNTITISASGANAGYVSFHRNPIFASDCSTIEEKGTFNIVYIFFLLQLFQKKIFKLQTGGAQPHVYPEHLKPLELVFPQEVTEQDAIANILIDIDEELSGLEKQMNKYQLIKQGMMQTLLTGKIRLV